MFQNLDILVCIDQVIWTRLWSYNAWKLNRLFPITSLTNFYRCYCASYACSSFNKNSCSCWWIVTLRLACILLLWPVSRIYLIFVYLYSVRCFRSRVKCFWTVWCLLNETIKWGEPQKWNWKDNSETEIPTSNSIINTIKGNL